MTTLQAVIDALQESLDSLTEETCTRIYQELEAYAGIDRAALGAAVDRNLHTALLALREGRVPPVDTLDGAEQTARERYESGVPVEEIVRGFRISIALIHERFVDLAMSLGLPVQTTVTGSRVLWAVGDAFTTRIITAYHALEVDTALRDAQRRAGALRALLAGEPVDDPILGVIDPQRPYAVVRGEAPAGAEAERLRHRLETTGGSPEARAIVLRDGGSCLGVVTTRPEEVDVPVGLGPFVLPIDLPRSDRTAREALRLAQRLGRRGVQSIDDLGWRLAAASRPDIWQSYADRFLQPVRAEGVFGEEILAAVRAWLVHGQSIPRAAEALHVHVNTVRYRLRRFEELTGERLADPDTVVGAWWVLELGDPSSFAADL